MAHDDPILHDDPIVDDADAFLIRSTVRSGHKREFSFAIRAQAELPASLGRTRSRTAPPPPPPPPKSLNKPLVEKDGFFPKPPTPLRLVVKQIGSSDTPIVVVDEDGHSEDPVVIDALSVPAVESKRVRKSYGSPGDPIVVVDDGGGATPVVIDAIGGEHKGKEMLKEAAAAPAITEVPGNMGELIATGLLQGLTVKYIDPMGKVGELMGVISGTYILCHCASCKGSNAISADQFEQHAMSSQKHPSDFIYLENGNTISDVLESYKDVPLVMLETSIQNAIGVVHLKKPITCQKCNDTGKFASLCDSCLKSDHRQTTPSLADGNNDNSRLSLASDSSGSISKNISSHKIIFGKLTRKDLGLHKLVFVGDNLPKGTEVGYYARGKVVRQGYIKDSGIFCFCCTSVVSPSQFEAHAGYARRRKPYNNIYTSNGVSLHELSVSLSKGRKLSASEYDDFCTICEEGGDLLLCDVCPRAFHIDCVGLSSIPKGDWYCRYCKNKHQRDKYLEYNANAIAAGRVPGVDSIEQIFKRCIRIVETSGRNAGGCVFCRHDDFSKEFGPRTVLLCDQCEREYHVGCLKDHNMGNLKEIPKEEWFCSTDCTRIHDVLQELIFHGASDVIKKHGGDGLNNDANVDMRWRLLSRKVRGPDNNSLFKSAISILHESFDAIVDSETARDLIPCMVYGRSTTTQDFGGMYCAVLTVDSSVVSTGILRVLGREVAELPLVATHKASQRQGYFQTLFSCIERLLASLNVKHLVLPAAEEAESVWTKKFGFKRIALDQLREYTGGAHTMVFEGTSMLHKPIPNFPVTRDKGCKSG